MENLNDDRREPDWRDDDMRADIYDDDHGIIDERDWTPPHGMERPYKADDLATKWGNREHP